MPIWEKFRSNGVEIPFPQTDLHIKTGKVKVKKDTLTVVETEPDNYNELVETET
ncbi:MAG: hypothetical protein HC846_01950 [Blastocatellia bacterium]|nr:hypothetical protein [Blastocatellia bacterium]